MQELNKRRQIHGALNNNNQNQNQNIGNVQEG